MIDDVFDVVCGCTNLKNENDRRVAMRHTDRWMVSRDDERVGCIRLQPQSSMLFHDATVE